MPVDTIPEPVKHLSHEAIRDMLKPYAMRGWLDRFDLVKNRGQKFWLYVVRDFNIQHPKVEMIIEDIVRVLERKKERNSAVRAEMNKLEAAGKLHIDTPEVEELWEKRLQEERDANDQWDKEDHAARMEQRALDIKAIEEKEKRGDQAPTSPIAIKSQDPKHNPVMNSAGFAVRPISQDTPALPTTKPEEKPSSKETAEVSEEVKHGEKPPLEPVKATIAVEIQPDTAAADSVKLVAPVTLEPNEEKPAKHAKELSETEKKQAAFVPKPPPEKEAPDAGPKLKSIEADGQEVYNKDTQGEPKPKLDTIEGLPTDAIKRLNDIGVTTVEAFEKMNKPQAKQILGAPLFAKLQKHIKS